MSNLQVITDEYEWRNILLTHSITDVYIQYEYVKPMALHFHAAPILINYSTDAGGFLYCLLVTDLAYNAKFNGYIPHNVFFDAESPYGYGGPFFYGNSDFSEEEIECCRETIKNEMKKRGIISQFIRFYPLLFKQEKSLIIVDKYGTYKKTIYMDLTDESTILSNLDSQYRRKIRKAVSAGVVIEHDKGEQICEFMRLYNATMRMHEADDMYFFGEKYYYSLIRNFNKNIEVFYARIDGNFVGASIFLFDNNFMHFHLGGRDTKAPNIPFENLLMVEAAKWGACHGLKKLHIGGGLSDDDSLFQYKKKFNKSGILPFYIGRTIFDQDRYNQLIHIREDSDINFDSNNKFYIQYRF